MPPSKEAYQNVKSALQNHATLSIVPLKIYLEQMKAVQPLLKKPKVTKAQAQLLLDFSLSPENL
jgi:hypothetical protein